MPGMIADHAGGSGTYRVDVSLLSRRGPRPGQVRPGRVRPGGGMPS